MNDQRASLSLVPYWRLSSFYFFYFASLGAIVPYWSLYLKAQGFGAQEIGTLIAFIPATKIFAPYIWGWVADHTQRPITIIRIANLLAVLAFIGVFFGNSYWWLALVMFMFSFFWNSSLPQFEATTLNHLNKEIHRYSNIRLWGSLGFIFIVVGLGEFFQSQSIGGLPFFILALLLAIFLVSLAVPECLQVEHEEQGHIMNVVRQPVVLAFLAICFLMVLSHGPYYTFYSIYLEDHGYSRRFIGIFWAVGVIAEVGIFLLMHRIIPLLGVRLLLLITFALTALRWLLIGYFPDNSTVLFIAQLFHAFSFGMFHAVGILLVHQFFKGKHQGRGQALYASLSFGVGGAAGSLLSGLLWDRMDHSSLFAMAALAALLAWGIVWKFIRVDIK
ncbi:MAG: MFS transporter [Gammaproteobacteria bacterium]|nr:MFS transporter [Gammaproteobacteria bacterium]